jgi:hypothetical protein
MLAVHSISETLALLAGTFTIGVGWSLGCWLVKKVLA